MRRIRQIKQLNDEEIGLAMNLIYDDGEPMMIVNEGVMSIGRVLRTKRIADGMNLSDLAKLLRMSPGTLSEIETGKREIPNTRMKAIEDYIYKTLYIYDRLEFRIDSDEEDIEDSGFEYVFGFNNDDERCDEQ